GVFLVAGMNDVTTTATATTKQWLTNVLGRYGDTLAPIDIGNRALVDSFSNRLADMTLVAAKKALPVDSALVLAVESPVDDMGSIHSATTGKTAGHASPGIA